MFKVGIVGYSGQKFSNERASTLIKKAFEQIPSDDEIAIVSGLTAIGIPNMAYQEADRRGWKTIGIACSKAQDYPCYPCDEAHIVGAEWGDESSLFLDSIDMLIRVGGGKQSFAECETAKAMGLAVYGLELEPEFN